jgi:hypothetical protein
VCTLQLVSVPAAKALAAVNAIKVPAMADRKFMSVQSFVLVRFALCVSFSAVRDCGRRDCLQVSSLHDRSGYTAARKSRLPPQRPAPWPGKRGKFFCGGRNRQGAGNEYKEMGQCNRPKSA